MPPPVRADYDSRERAVIERASVETKRMNEHMDKIDANLDNMSDNLKQRFKQVVISQLSLMKYRQEDTFADSLNVYKKEVSKVEYQPKITTPTNSRNSQVKKEIQRWNANVETNQHDLKGEVRYSRETSTVGRSGNSPFSVISNKVTGSPCFDTELVKTRAIIGSNKRNQDIETQKPDRSIDIKQATRNAMEDSTKPTAMRASPSSFKGNTEASNAFNVASRKEQMPTSVKTRPNDIYVSQNNLRTRTTPEHVSKRRRDTVSPVLDGRITPDFIKSKMHNITNTAVRGDQNNTKIETNDSESKMAALSNTMNRTKREIKPINAKTTASEYKPKTTVNVTGLSAEKHRHAIDKNAIFNNTNLAYKENVAIVDVGTKESRNNKTSPASKNMINRSREPNITPTGLTTINDTQNVRLSPAFKNYMSNINGAKIATHDTSLMGTSTVDNDDTVDGQGTQSVRFSTPISEKYNWHKPSISFSPILASRKTPPTPPAKQNRPEIMQPSPVKQKLQSLVSNLGEYNEHAQIQTADAKEVLSRIQDNDAPQTQPRSLPSTGSPQTQTVTAPNQSQAGPCRQTGVRDSDKGSSNLRQPKNISDIDEYIVRSTPTNESADAYHDVSTTKNRTPSTEPPSAIRFQSTIKYTPIVDSSIVPKSMKHSIYCSDCSDSTGNSEHGGKKGEQQDNEEISVADIEKDAARDKIMDIIGRAGILERNRISTQATRGYSTIADPRTHTNRNNGSFIGTNTSPRDIPVRQTTTTETDNERPKNLPRYKPEDESVRMTSTLSNPTRGFHDILPNKTMHGLGQAKKNTSALIGAYETIKMKLYNSALNSLMSSMKSTVEENVDRDFDREMWTALNQSVTEMTEEFESYFSSIGSQNADTWSVNISHLDSLVQRLLSEGPCSDRLRLKVDVEDTMSRLRSHLEDSCRERRNLSSEVEKILATLKNLTECLAVCGDRYFGDRSGRKRQNPQSADVRCENVASTSMTNGFLATANRIRHRLMNGYTSPKDMDTAVKIQSKETNEGYPGADSNVRATHLKEDYSNVSKQRMNTPIPLDDTTTINEPQSYAASEVQDVLASNNDELPQQTTATMQQQAPPRNRSPQHFQPPSINQRRMNDFRNYGLLILIIFATAKFFAHFGPDFLQVVHDILVGIMMYVSCNVRLVHFEPNFT